MGGDNPLSAGGYPPEDADVLSPPQIPTYIRVSPGIPKTNGRLEGFLSSLQGMYLAGWKATFPAGEDVPCRQFREWVSKDTREGRGISTSGCGCRFPWKKQPDIQMQSEHL
jgi:hypothetical protein